MSKDDRSLREKPSIMLAHVPDDSMEHLSTHPSIPVEEAPTSLRSIAVVAASCLAYFSSQYSINAVAVHIYAIGSALHDYRDVVWFVNGASLVVAATGPVIAYHSNFRSRKWIILAGLSVGVAGQVVSGVAKGMHSIIIGQALVGVTLATQPLLVTIPTEVLAVDKRRFALLATSISGGLGGFAGSLAGGALLNAHFVAGDSFTWQWLFRVGAALYGATLILLGVTYQPGPLQVCVTARQVKVKFDWTGSFLLTLGLVPLMTGLTIGGEPSPWRKLPVIITLAVGGTCMMLFIAWEIWGTSTGLFHHTMLKHGHNFLIALTLFFIEGILFVVFLVWYNQEVYEIYEPNPLLQGLRFSVFYGAVTLLAPFIAIYCSRKRSVKAALTVGNGFALLAAALMTTLNLQSGKVVIFYAALAGVGLSAPLVILMTTIHLSAPNELIHAVAPLATLVRTVGIVTGNVLSYLVVNTQFSVKLPQDLLMALQPLGITSGQVPDLIQALRTRDDLLVNSVEMKEAFPPHVLQAAREAAAKAQLEAFRFVWIAVAGLAGFAVVICLLISPVDTQTSLVQESESPQDTRSYNVYARSEEHGFGTNEKRQDFSHVFDIKPE